MPPRVLVVDDDRHLLRSYYRLLSAEGFRPSVCSSAGDALKVFARQPPDAAIIDVDMPDINGISLFKALRASPTTKHIPLVLLTGLDVPDTLLEAAAAGLRQPEIIRKGSEPALIRRLKELLSHPAPQAEEEHLLRNGPLAIDLIRRVLLIPGHDPVRLPEKRFDVLAALFRRAGPMSQMELFDAVWSPDNDPRIVKTTILRLRKDLKPYPIVQILTNGDTYELSIRAPHPERPSSRRR